MSHFSIRRKVNNKIETLTQVKRTNGENAQKGNISVRFRVFDIVECLFLPILVYKEIDQGSFCLLWIGAQPQKEFANLACSLERFATYLHTRERGNSSYQTSHKGTTAPNSPSWNAQITYLHTMERGKTSPATFLPAGLRLKAQGGTQAKENGRKQRQGTRGVCLGLTIQVAVLKLKQLGSWDGGAIHSMKSHGERRSKQAPRQNWTYIQLHTLSFLLPMFFPHPIIFL